MAETRTIARPYAEAVFKLAKTSGTLPAWSEMLQLLAAIAVDEQIRCSWVIRKFRPGDWVRCFSAYAVTSLLMKAAILFCCLRKTAE